MSNDSSNGGTFSNIAEGYGGAQQSLSRLGLLPGSFTPADSNGAAVQIQTPPPPRFPIVVSTTMPYPAGAPIMSGALSPPQPSTLPAMFSAPQPTYTQGMPQANFSAAMSPQAAPFPYGVPIAAPNWTRSFTEPTQGFGSQGSLFSPGSAMSDMAFTGGIPHPIYPRSAGIGVNITQNRLNAGLRTGSRMEELGLSALSAGSVAVSAIGAYGALSGMGAGLAGLSAAAGVVAAPLAAVAMWGDAYREERAGTHAIQDTFSGMSMGNLVSPTGRGINPMAARQIQNRFKQTTVGDPFFTKEDMFTTMNMAQESGLMRGSTNSVEQIVSRVKVLAKVTKSIMDLGEGITQQDAMELQAISQNMGISSKQFVGQQIGVRLTAAARASGQTVAGLMSGAGAEGASMYSQMGMNAGSGMVMGAHTTGIAASMVNSGNMSARELAMLGGESGIQNMLMRGVAGSQARNAGNMTYGLLTGPNALQAMATGDLSYKDARKQGLAVLNNPGWNGKQRGIAKQFMEEMAPDMLNEAQEQLSPERQTLMFLSQARDAVAASGNKKTVHTALTELTGSSDTATTYMKLIKDPKALRALQQQSAIASREAASIGREEYREYKSISSNMGRAWDSMWRDASDITGVSAAADAAARSDFEAHAKAIGVDPDSYKYRAGNLGLNSDTVKSLTEGDFGANIAEVLASVEAPITPLMNKKHDTLFGYKNDFAKDILKDAGYAGHGMLSNRLFQSAGVFFQSADAQAAGGSVDTHIKKQHARVQKDTEDSQGVAEFLKEYHAFKRGDKAVAGDFIDEYESNAGPEVTNAVRAAAQEISKKALRSGKASVLGNASTNEVLTRHLKGIELTPAELSNQRSSLRSLVGAIFTQADGSQQGAVDNIDASANEILQLRADTPMGASGYLKEHRVGIERNRSHTVREQAYLDATQSISRTGDDGLLQFIDNLAAQGITSKEDIAALINTEGEATNIGSGGMGKNQSAKLRKALDNPLLADQVKLAYRDIRHGKVVGAGGTVSAAVGQAAGVFSGAVEEVQKITLNDDVKEALGGFAGEAGFKRGDKSLDPMIGRVMAAASETTNVEQLAEALYGKGTRVATLDKGVQEKLESIKYAQLTGDTKGLAIEVQNLAKDRIAEQKGDRAAAVSTADDEGLQALIGGVVGELQQQNIQARASLETLITKSSEASASATRFIDRVSAYMADHPR